MKSRRIPTWTDAYARRYAAALRELRATRHPEEVDDDKETCLASLR
jgi:hypothetical protein